MTKRGRLLHVLDLVDNISTWVFKVSSLLILVIMIVTVYEVIVRYAFNAPTTWSHEVGAFLCGLAWVYGGAYCLLGDHHVKMDAVYNHLSLKAKAVLGLIGFPFFLLFLVALLQGTAAGAWTSILNLESSPSQWHPPIYPLKTLLPGGIFIFLLQLTVKFIRDLLIVITRRNS